MWSVDKILKVLVVINYGGLHIYRLGASPLLLSTFDFNTLVSWQSMNDMLIINVRARTRTSTHARSLCPAMWPARVERPPRCLPPPPESHAPCVRAVADVLGAVCSQIIYAAKGEVAKRREKLRFLTRESLQMRNLLSKYAEAVLADIVKRLKEREARQKTEADDDDDDDDDDDY